MGEPALQVEVRRPYHPIPTLRLFHESGAQIRCMVGPVGSGKTSAATMEVGYYLPLALFEAYGIKKTRWAIIRNSYVELRDTTQKTVFDWFPDGKFKVQASEYTLYYENGIEVEMLFRSCDTEKDIKKFKSLELTGYWIDESIEVAEGVKRMLKNRIGRFPQKSPVRFGIETTNPPDVEHPTYSQFAWSAPPPGPLTTGDPLPNHAGFWQPPYENKDNLRQNYYEDLKNDYKDNQDWADIYILGQPGVVARGRQVYANFRRHIHVAKEPLVWNKGTLYVGWDNSGNCPACVIIQIPTARQVQVLREFHTDRMGIVDFTEWVKAERNRLYPDAEYKEWADPAGEQTFSKAKGGFTSNAELMRDSGVDTTASEQNPVARVQAVDQQLGLIDGMLIDPGCTRLINGFISGYCRKEIGHTGIFKEKPEKNRWSHVHDGLQYVMVPLFKGNMNVTPIDIHRKRRKPGIGWMAN